MALARRIGSWRYGCLGQQGAGGGKVHARPEWCERSEAECAEAFTVVSSVFDTIIFHEALLLHGHGFSLFVH